MNDTTVKGGASAERTTLSLSLSKDDKKKLQILAVMNETTIAGLIHSWIAEQGKDIKL